MNLIVISLLAVATMSLVPHKVQGRDVDASHQQHPQQTVGEVWQEDEREVLIRNERGAKNKDGQMVTGAAGAGSSGKGGNHNKHIHRNGGKKAQNRAKKEPNLNANKRSKSHPNAPSSSPSPNTAPSKRTPTIIINTHTLTDVAAESFHLFALWCGY